MSEERGRLQGEIEKGRIEIESLQQAKQQLMAENATLLERLGTLEEHQVQIFINFSTNTKEPKSSRFCLCYVLVVSIIVYDTSHQRSFIFLNVYIYASMPLGLALRYILQ